MFWKDCLEQAYSTYKWVTDVEECWESNWAAKIQRRNSIIWRPNSNSVHEYWMIQAVQVFVTIKNSTRYDQLRQVIASRVDEY